MMARRRAALPQINQGYKKLYINAAGGFNIVAIMKAAWRGAKELFRDATGPNGFYFGKTLKQVFAAALRQIWANAKAGKDAQNAEESSDSEPLSFPGNKNTVKIDSSGLVEFVRNDIRKAQNGALYVEVVDRFIPSEFGTASYHRHDAMGRSPEKFVTELRNSETGISYKLSVGKSFGVGSGFGFRVYIETKEVEVDGKKKIQMVRA
jgi:hypothetical protein